MKILPLQTRVLRNLRRRLGKNMVKTRRQWGSRYPAVYEYRLKYKPVSRVMADTLVQHITVTFDSGTLIGDFYEDMRTVERIGFERFGSGFSYNAAVDMVTGMLGMGMPLKAKGTHTVNDKNVPGYSHDQNLVARAIAALGMPGKELSPKAENTICHFIAAMIDEGALTPDPDYVPHSLFAAKDCPTDAVRNKMDRIYKRAKGLTKTAGYKPPSRWRR